MRVRVLAGLTLIAASIGHIAWDATHPEITMGAFAILVTTVLGSAGSALLARSN